MNDTWCPQCGPDVCCDEDGCCINCGADATGDGVEKAHRVKKALQQIVGAATSEELNAMETAVRLAPAPEKDRADALNAIHALQALFP